MPYKFPTKETKKRIHPIWGGIGCILIPTYLVGSYLLAQWLIRQNKTLSLVYIPGDITPLQQTIGLAALICIVTFAVTAIVWGWIRGPVGGPLDIRYSRMRHIRRRY